MIEVKAYGKSARGTFIWLEARQYEEAKVNPDFWVYVVDNVVQGDPEHFGLVQLGGEELGALVLNAKEQCPLRQIDDHVDVRVYSAIETRVRFIGHNKNRLLLQSVHACSPASDVIEASGTVDDGDPARALAARLHTDHLGWLCMALRLR